MFPQQKKVNVPVTVSTLDELSGRLSLTNRQVLDWEARHASHCSRYHRQPCECSPWGAAS